MEFSLRQDNQLKFCQPLRSTNATNQAAAIMTAIDLKRVSLSGSNTREEWILKNKGVSTMAANQPASINPSHQREILDSIRLSLPSLKSQLLCRHKIWLMMLALLDYPKENLTALKKAKQTR